MKDQIMKIFGDGTSSSCNVEGTLPIKQKVLYANRRRRNVEDDKPSNPSNKRVEYRRKFMKTH